MGCGLLYGEDVESRPLHRFNFWSRNAYWYILWPFWLFASALYYVLFRTMNTPAQSGIPCRLTVVCSTVARSKALEFLKKRALNIYLPWR